MTALDISIDIETLSTKANAAVLQIGACTMFPNDNEEREVFLVSIPARYYYEQLPSPYDIDKDTENWWAGQSEAAKEALHLNLVSTPAQALLELSNFFARVRFMPADKNHRVWANSPAFDCIILKHAAFVEELRLPWRFFQERDYRTIKSLAPPGAGEAVEPTWITPHRADHDAIRQALHIERWWDEMENRYEIADNFPEH